MNDYNSEELFNLNDDTIDAEREATINLTRLKMLKFNNYRTMLF